MSSLPMRTSQGSLARCIPRAVILMNSSLPSALGFQPAAPAPLFIFSTSNAPTAFSSVKPSCSYARGGSLIELFRKKSSTSLLVFSSCFF